MTEIFGPGWGNYAIRGIVEAEVPEPVDLSMVEANELMNHLRRDDFRRALNAEMNFAQFAKGQVRENLDQASALLSFFRARSDLR